MKRIALVFLIAILVPAILLAALAVRSLRDQEVIVNSQRALLHQATCEEIAANINLFMDDMREFYGQVVDELVETRSEEVVDGFDKLVTNEWSQVGMGSVVSDVGVVCSPVPSPNGWGADFLQNHGDFLTNNRTVEVYQAPQLLREQIRVVRDESVMEALEDQVKEETADSVTATAGTESAPVAKTKKKVAVSSRKLEEFGFEEKSSVKPSSRFASDAFAAPAPEMQRESLDRQVAGKLDSVQFRNVAPGNAPGQQQLNFAPAPESERLAGGRGRAYSVLNREAVTQNDLTAEEDEGAVSRIIDGELHILLWKRHSELPGFTLWAELDLASIKGDLVRLIHDYRDPNSAEVSIALLDAAGQLVGQTAENFTTDWSSPFVAAEVGQILPRWEVAAYLLDPGALDESARTARLTLWLITLILLGAVGVGSVLVMRSVTYEMRLATQKTDFVSNVSHELKTPLTSIRMFSELLERTEQQDGERVREYSRVIGKESARLGRLINRLLDFSRLDRGEYKLEKTRVELRNLVEETVANHRMQMESEGLEVDLVLPPEETIFIDADSDALSQVLLNLLSNAEKYAATGGEVEVVLSSTPDGKAQIEIRDRGPGIRLSNQRKIFDKFYRADESMNSGIEGSGIGLALCHQIVEMHGGTISYARREKGGSVFTISLPLAKDDENS